MDTNTCITFVVSVNNAALFKDNFLASPCLGQLEGHEVLVQEGFSSAAKAYNAAIDRAANDLIVFCHQDILLPEAWPCQLQTALDQLERTDPRWGVLGSYGKSQDGRGWGHVYSSGRGVIGEALPRPVAVQTLDEIVLILRKSSGLLFDASLPHFHFYGTDICLRSAERGMRSYAISAFCIHNTHQTLVLPKEFYEGCRHIRQVWKYYLPIQTTCIRITKWNVPEYSRRLREWHLRYIRRQEYGGTRVQDPLVLLEEVAGKP
jgi:hypothetical protein